jgi:ankyrin repeat protein
MLEGRAQERSTARREPGLMNLQDAVRALQPAIGKQALLKLLDAEGAAGDLFRASAAGDLESIRAVLANDSNLAGAQVEGWSPLHLAIALDEIAAAELLITLGASPTTPAPGLQCLPLHRAAERGQSGIVDLLIKHGARADARDMHKDSPLEYAVREKGGDAETVHLLLRAGADHHHRDGRDRTAFQNVLGYGNVAVARVMIEFGADVNDRTAADCRTWQEDPTEWTLLHDPWAARPLYVAVCSGSVELVELLLNAGARIDDLSFSWSALHAAAAMPDSEMVELLLARRADLYVQSADGRTPAELLAGFSKSAELLRAAMRE